MCADGVAQGGTGGVGRVVGVLVRSELLSVEALQILAGTGLILLNFCLRVVLEIWDGIVTWLTVGCRRLRTSLAADFCSLHFCLPQVTGMPCVICEENTVSLFLALDDSVAPAKGSGCLCLDIFRL